MVSKSLVDALTRLTTALVVVFMLVPSTHVRAQASDRNLSQFAHRSWGIKEGAPSSIWEIAQTQDGFLWLAGPFGLVRFDGISFERFQSSSGDRLPEKGVSALYASPDGGLWIGYRAGGIAYIKQGRATAYLKPGEGPESPVFAFARDLDGTLWAAHGNGLARRTAKGWEQVGKEWNFNGEIATSIFLDRAGTLWVGTQQTLVFLPRGAHRFQVTAEHLSSSDQILQDGQDALWVVAGNDGLIHKVSVNADKPAKAHGIPLSSAQVLFDSRGALWITTPGDGLFRTQSPSAISETPAETAKKSLEHFGSLNGLTSDLGYAVFEDREGNVWVGTASGLDRFSRRDIVPVPLPPGHEGFSLAPGDHGDVWVSSLTKDLAHIDGNIVSFAPEVSGSTVGYRDPNGTVWWGQKNGVQRYSAGHFTFIPFPAGNPPVTVFTITSREDGLWVAKEMGEPYRLQNGSWSQPVAQMGLPAGKHPLFSHTDAAGRMWLSYTKVGIYLLDHGRTRVYPPSGGLDIGAVLSMGGEGTDLFVGGESGLAAFDGTAFRRLSLAGDRTMNSIVGLAQSSDGDLWLSDADGIIAIRRTQWAQALRDPTYRMEYRSFDYSDGLPSTPQLGRPLNTMIRATDGRIWFATDAAPAWIDPHHLHTNGIRPVVSITHLSADGQSYALGSTAVLPIGANAIRVGFTAASLTAPERVTFRYRLIDADPAQWQPATSRREAFFTNLAPGRYRFEVFAANEDGLNSGSTALLTFVIPPRFYQTGLFVAAVGVGILLLIWALHRIRLHQLSVRLRARINDRIAERERIARELHDTFLQGIYGLVCQLEVVRRNSAEQDSVHATLTQALDGADRMLAEGRGRIMQLRMTTADHLPEALEALCAEQSHQRSRNISFKSEGAFRPLASSVHDEIYRVCAEALANACQHAQASEISVGLTYTVDSLQLVVRDDGIGIDESLLASRHKGGHWGLPGMFERSRTIGGRLVIRNVEPRGVEVLLTVGLSNAPSSDRVAGRLLSFLPFRPRH